MIGLLATLSLLSTRAAACSCAGDGPTGWLHFPAEGEPVATDVALLWTGVNPRMRLRLTGPDGPVAIDVQWSSSGATHTAMVLPQVALLTSSTYTLSDAEREWVVTTGTETESPPPAGAELDGVCVEVGWGSDCLYSNFDLELPPLTAGYYVADFTLVGGERFRVFGTAEGVTAFAGPCGHTMAAADGWEFVAVKVAAVSPAGEFGPWSTEFSGAIPRSGESNCFDPVPQPSAGEPTGGCAGGVLALPLLLLRRRAILPRDAALPRLRPRA